MKRSIDDREIEALAMANCIMLLARVGGATKTASDRVFECKTCNKKFPSFQALGGHRASHKKPRLIMDHLGVVSNAPPVKAKTTHECSICGQEFPLGQALGGHMRRHRAERKNIPVLKKCNSKRIMLDLNLTPYENELKLDKPPPALGCF